MCSSEVHVSGATLLYFAPSVQDSATSVFPLALLRPTVASPPDGELKLDGCSLFRFQRVNFGCFLLMASSCSKKSSCFEIYY